MDCYENQSFKYTIKTKCIPFHFVPFLKIHCVYLLFFCSKLNTIAILLMDHRESNLISTSSHNVQPAEFLRLDKNCFDFSGIGSWASIKNFTALTISSNPNDLQGPFSVETHENEDVASIHWPETFRKSNALFRRTLDFSSTFPATIGNSLQIFQNSTATLPRSRKNLLRERARAEEMLPSSSQMTYKQNAKTKFKIHEIQILILV